MRRSVDGMRRVPVAEIVLTKPQENALRALAAEDATVRAEQASRGFPLADYRPVRVAARTVAKYLWPDSVGWHKRSRRGSTAAGGALGATMPMKAGSLLSRLYGWGLAWHEDYGYAISSRGREYLDLHPGALAECPPHDPGHVSLSSMRSGFDCVRCGAANVPFTGLDR